MFIVLSGIVPLAVVAYKKGTKFDTSTVKVEATAIDVYSTELGIIYDDPAIELMKKDDKKRSYTPWLPPEKQGESNPCEY